MKYRYDIETNYGYGYEVEASYDTLAEANADLKEYEVHCRHYGGYCRIVKRKETDDEEIR